MTDAFYARDRRVYRFAAAALDTAAIFGRFIGPAGKLGRVRGIECIVTAALTVAVTNVIVGVNGAVLPAAMQIPILAINLGHVMSAAELALAGADEVAGTNDVILTADTVIECSSDGGATAGDGDIIVTVDWF